MKKILVFVAVAISLVVLSSCTINIIPKEYVNVEYVTNSDVPMLASKALIDHKVAVPSDPVKEGYVFVGWFSDASLNNPFDFSKKVDSDVTLYAKWQDAREVEQINITYVLDGGVNASKNIASKIIASELVLGEPTKENYVFAGWYADDQFTGNPITKLDINNTSDITLYAKYIASETCNVFTINHSNLDDPTAINEALLGQVISYNLAFNAESTLDLVSGDLHIAYDATNYQVSVKTDTNVAYTLESGKVIFTNVTNFASLNIALEFEVIDIINGEASINTSIQNGKRLNTLGEIVDALCYTIPTVKYSIASCLYGTVTLLGASGSTISPVNASVELINENGEKASLQTAADGSYLYNNLIPGTYTIRISQDDYTSFEKQVVITTDGLKVDCTLEFDYQAEVSGIVHLIIDSNMNYDLTAPSMVQLTKLNGNSLELSQNVDNSATFTFTDLPAGKYCLTVTAEGYQPYVERFNIMSEAQQYTAQPYLVPAGELGGVSGRVYDSECLAGISSSITLSNRDTFNQTYQTNSDGTYMISDLVPGVYTATVNPTIGSSLNGYFVVLPGVELANIDIAIHSDYVPTTLKVTITWDANEDMTYDDLDAHLASPVHVYYDAKNDDYAKLTDSKNSGEMMEIYLEPGTTFAFYVHNYTQKDCDPTDASCFSDLNVKVTIQVDNLGAFIIEPKIGAEGNLWQVFGYNSAFGFVVYGEDLASAEGYFTYESTPSNICVK